MPKKAKTPAIPNSLYVDCTVNLSRINSIPGPTASFPDAHCREQTNRTFFQRIQESALWPAIIFELCITMSNPVIRIINLTNHGIFLIMDEPGGFARLLLRGAHKRNQT
jgi:hypothetical protein